MEIEEFVPLDERDRYNLQLIRKKLKSANLSRETLAELLSEAISLADKTDENLPDAMVPVTEKAIQNSIDQEPENLSTVLFPIIGSAIRKAINHLLAEIMEKTNRSLESVFSVQRIAWRIEAKKSGLPYYEIVLRHTMVYRVEHAFLIHKKSGLLLLARSQDGSVTADDDMVASMLSAVRSYIKDSLSLDQEQSVNGISVGDYTVITEEGPAAILALIIRGNPDQEIQEQAAKTIELVHGKFARQLRTFSGNSQPFESASDLLDSCLVTRDGDTTRKKPVYAIILISGLVLALATFSFLSYTAYRNRSEFLSALDNEPGIVLVSHQHTFGKSRLKILRDAHASDVTTIADTLSFDLSRFTITEEPYISPHFSTISDNRDSAGTRAIPAELVDLARQLSQYIVFFEQDSGELASGQETMLETAGRLVATIVEKSREYDIPVSVQITGHSAGTTDDAASYEISEARAQKAFDAFVSINTPLKEYVSARGVGITEPVIPDETTEEDRVKNRSVTFKAVFE